MLDVRSKLNEIEASIDEYNIDVHDSNYLYITLKLS